jgi:cell division protein FtsL
MRRLTGILGLVVAAVAALFLFGLKQDVRQKEDDLRAVHRNILEQQEAIHVLETEWSYLNHPARLSDLAKRHLGMQPISAARIVSLEDLPFRAPEATLAAAPAAAKMAPDSTANGAGLVPASAPSKIGSSQ